MAYRSLKVLGLNSDSVCEFYGRPEAPTGWRIQKRSNLELRIADSEVFGSGPVFLLVLNRELVKTYHYRHSFLHFLLGTQEAG